MADFPPINADTRGGRFRTDSYDSVFRAGSPAVHDKAINWAAAQAELQNIKTTQQSIESLPTQVLLHIAAFLPLHDVRHLSQVSQVMMSKLNELTKDLMKDKLFSDGFDTPLHRAVRKDSKELLSSIFRVVESPGDYFNQYGETALHIAARIGNLKVVDLLLEYPSFDITDENHVGETPLMIAIRARHSDVVNQLFDEGAAPSYYSGTECHLALHYMTKYPTPIPRKLFFQVLSNGESPDRSDQFGKTCLHWAAVNGHLEAMAALLRLQAARHAINKKDHNGRTALWIAASLGYDDVVELLMRYGADPNIACNKGYTPLDMATLMEKQYASEAITNPGSRNRQR